ncbi:MAG TPA: hypothetical protein VIW64_07350 [Pyrinomonadaceae bacterium]|jgi:hypothetical protein
MSTPSAVLAEPELSAAPVPFLPRFIKIWDLPEPASLQAWDDFKVLWKSLPAEEFERLLCYLYDKFCTFGYVGLQHRDGFIENADGETLLANCLTQNIDEWPAQALALSSMFWLFDSAAVLVTEYNQQPLELDALRSFLNAKLGQYSNLFGRGDEIPNESVVSLARQINNLRAEIPSHYVRSFSIDGRTWEREERYLDGRATLELVYPGIKEEIRNHLGVDLPETGPAVRRFQGLVDLLIARGTNPFEILVAIADAAIKDERLQADYAVITVPQGRALPAFWDTRIKDVCSYAVVRPDFSATDHGVDFQPDQIRRAIQRRMRFNTSCRSKNYHPLREVRRKAQPFQFPDIAFNESSHHTGHIRSGIRNSARTHFEIRIPGWAQFGELRGFGDFRVNRATDEVSRRYTFDELEHLLAYGRWCKTVFDYSLARGVAMDPKYCED